MHRPKNDLEWATGVKLHFAQSEATQQGKLSSRSPSADTGTRISPNACRRRSTSQPKCLASPP